MRRWINLARQSLTRDILSTKARSALALTKKKTKQTEKISSHHSGRELIIFFFSIHVNREEEGKGETQHQTYHFTIG